MLDAHCYASSAAACCHTADAMCFRIDYTSGISSDANAWVCVCASMQECVYKEPGVSKKAIVLLRLIHL